MVQMTKFDPMTPFNPQSFNVSRSGVTSGGGVSTKSTDQEMIDKLETSGFPSETEKQPAGISGAEAGQDAFNSAVLSSADIEENILPDLQEETDEFAKTGKFVDEGGTERFADGEPIEEKDDSDIFLENLAEFNRKFGRAETDATGINKTPGGGLDTTGAFDDDGNVIGGTKVPTIAEEEDDSFYKEIGGLIDEMKANLDAQTKRQIDSIEQTFKLRKEQQAEINRRAEAARSTALLLGGSARYAPISASGIVRQQETAGLQAIAELDAQEKSLINAALQAQSEGDFALLEEQLQLAKDKRAEKQEATKALNDQMVANNKELRDRAKEQREQFTFLQKQEKETVESISSLVLNSLGDDDTENAKIIADFAEQYEIDPNVLLNSILELDRDIEKEKRTAGGNLKFVSGTAKQQGGVFNPVTGIFTPLKGGGGAGGATGAAKGKITKADLPFATNEEDLTITRVMRLLPTKLKDSETEREDRKVEILRGIRSGQTVQDIVDEIKGFIITNEPEKNLATYLRTLSAGSDIDLSDLSAAINHNQPKKAMTIVENENLKDAEGELASTVSSKTLIVNANRVLTLLKNVPTENLGAFDGRKFKVKKFFGLSDKEALATQQLETAMVNLLNEIRRKSLGTAVTKSEVEFLEPLLTDLLDQPEMIKTKMNELKVGTLAQHNQARGQTTLPHITEDELLDINKRLQTYRDMAGSSAQIRVRLQDGQTGTIDEADFDSNTMEKI